MIAFLSRHRTVIVSIGVIMVIINIALNAIVPADFAANQWPWMLAVSPMAAVGAVLAFRVSSSSVGWLLFGIAVAGSFGTWQGLNILGAGRPPSARPPAPTPLRTSLSWFCCSPPASPYRDDGTPSPGSLWRLPYWAGWSRS